jgi:hypothetical protein
MRFLSKRINFNSKFELNDYYSRPLQVFKRLATPAMEINQILFDLLST